METRLLEPGFVSRKMVKAALYEMPFLTAGAFFVVFGTFHVKMAGITLIMIASIATAVFVIRTLFMIDCPQCLRSCQRTGAGEFRCEACRIIWKSGDNNAR
jgi:hypothetical protein